MLQNTFICLKYSFYSQYGPSITPNNTAFVHHIIVYLCDALVNITDGTSSECMNLEGFDQFLTRCLLAPEQHIVKNQLCSQAPPNFLMLEVQKIGRGSGIIYHND